MGLKFVSRAIGLILPAASSVFFAFLAFGMWSFRGEDECYAVEFPNTKQFDHDPVTTDSDNFIGLKIHNISSRFTYVIYAGFVMEILLFIIVAMSMMKGSSQMQSLHSLLGYASLGWFLWLLSARYDHFGRVCSGDYLSDTDKNSFPLLQNATVYLHLYVLGICGFVALLFLSVLVYSCTASTSKAADAQSSNKAKEENKNHKE